MEAETRLLYDITLMLIVAGVCSVVLARVKLPAIIGYLTAGILLGPYIFPEVVVQPDTVEIFASIGIVMLMFFIGLELNLKGLRKVASFAMIIAAIEMTLMVVIGYSIGLALGLGTPEAIFLGVTISCASTAVVLGVMKDNKHMDSKLSKAVLGILIMEDIGIIIILALSAPIMGTSSSSSMLETFVVIIAFIGISVVVGLAVVPRMLNWVRKTLLRRNAVHRLGGHRLRHGHDLQLHRPVRGDRRVPGGDHRLTGRLLGGRLHQGRTDEGAVHGHILPVHRPPARIRP